MPNILVNIEVNSQLLPTCGSSWWVDGWVDGWMGGWWINQGVMASWGYNWDRDDIHISVLGNGGRRPHVSVVCLESRCNQAIYCLKSEDTNVDIEAPV